MKTNKYINPFKHKEIKSRIGGGDQSGKSKRSNKKMTAISINCSYFQIKKRNSEKEKGEGEEEEEEEEEKAVQCDPLYGSSICCCHRCLPTLASQRRVRESRSISEEEKQGRGQDHRHHESKKKRDESWEWKGGGGGAWMRERERSEREWWRWKEWHWEEREALGKGEMRWGRDKIGWV